MVAGSVYIGNAFGSVLRNARASARRSDAPNFWSLVRLATLLSMTSLNFSGLGNTVLIAAFDSGNLLDVARAVREYDPARRIVIAADNDHHLPRLAVPLPNVGMEKAIAATEAVGGVVLA